MSFEVSIKVDQVSKCYNVYDVPHDRLKQALVPRCGRWLDRLGVHRVGGELARRNFFKEFWALRGVSFEVRRGETVGIVGRNGSGKSTILQIIAGTLTPTAGEVAVAGRVAALLELGSGFNPDFTGLENVFLNGALLGFDQKDMEDRLDAILGFADIGPFIDRAVKTYSSGMLVRLAFAVQAQVQPQILIVDEALAVGDAKFQAKCFARLKKLKEEGTSILFVSHSTEQIVSQCDRALLLEGGSLVEEGKPKEVVNRYLDLLFGARSPHREEAGMSPETKAIDADEPPPLLSTDLSVDNFTCHPGYNKHEYRWGDGAAKITDFLLRSGGVDYPQAIESGAPVELMVSVAFLRQVIRPILGFTVKTTDGVIVYATNSEMQSRSDIGEAGRAGSFSQLSIKFQCITGSGDYFISLGIASRDGVDVIPHDRRYDCIHLHVIASKFHGLSDFKLEMAALPK